MILSRFAMVLNRHDIVLEMAAGIRFPARDAGAVDRGSVPTNRIYALQVSIAAFWL